MMKRWYFLTLWAAVAAFFLLLAGCVVQDDPDNQETSEPPHFPRGMWGVWVGYEAGFSSLINWRLHITSEKAIKVIGASNVSYDYTEHAGIVQNSANMITLTLFNVTYRLFPERLANASFTGKIAGFDNASTQRAMAGGKGWIDLVVEDLDSGSTTTTQTDGDGNFTVPDAIPGDTYGVTPDGGETVEVTPRADGDDVGIITITGGLNFKASVTPASGIMLADGTKYSCAITIKNIGSQAASACTYQITGPNGESIDGGILGSLSAGKEKTITILASCAAISEEKRFKKYTIVVTDPINDKIWNDSVSLLFYRSAITFTIMSDYIPNSTYGNNVVHAAAAGVVISPDRISYPFETQNRFGWDSAKTISVPRLRGNYLIAVVGTSLESVYGFDLSAFSTHLTESAFLAKAATFTDTGNYEPNDTEEAAAAVSAPVISYFHTGDIDFYRVTVE